LLLELVLFLAGCWLRVIVDFGRLQSLHRDLHLQSHNSTSISSLPLNIYATLWRKFSASKEFCD
jgi:hypothetical protein